MENGIAGRQRFLQNRQTVHRVFIKRDEGIDGEPGFSADLHQLVMGQAEMGGMEDGPGIVGGEVVTEGKAAKQARRGQRAGLIE